MSEISTKSRKTAQKSGKVLGPSECHLVARSSLVSKCRLDGNIARRKLLPEGIIWDDELHGFVLRVRASGHRSWIVKYRQRNTQRFVMLGEAQALPARAARAKARETLTEALLMDLPTPPKAVTGVTFRAFSKEFWRDYAPHWKPPTRRTSKAQIRNLLMPVFGHMELQAISRIHVNRWRDAMADRPGSFNRVVPILSVMMRYAEQLGLRPKGSNPCRGVPRYKRQLPERYLSKQEYDRLHRVLDGLEDNDFDVVNAIRLLIHTGARSSEIVDLRWRFVQPPRLVLPDSKTGPNIIYLNAQAVAVLDAMPRGRPDERVFKSKFRKQRIQITQSWARIRKLAALPDVRLHDLRHSFASSAIAQGIPLAVIGKLLGHALPESTVRYGHLADEVKPSCAPSPSVWAAMPCSILTAWRNRASHISGLRSGSARSLDRSGHMICGAIMPVLPHGHRRHCR